MAATVAGIKICQIDLFVLAGLSIIETETKSAREINNACWKAYEADETRTRSSDDKEDDDKEDEEEWEDGEFESEYCTKTSS